MVSWENMGNHSGFMGNYSGLMGIYGAFHGDFEWWIVHGISWDVPNLVMTNRNCELEAMAKSQ